MRKVSDRECINGGKRLRFSVNKCTRVDLPFVETKVFLVHSTRKNPLVNLSIACRTPWSTAYELTRGSCFVDIRHNGTCTYLLITCLFFHQDNILRSRWQQFQEGSLRIGFAICKNRQTWKARHLEQPSFPAEKSRNIVYRLVASWRRKYVNTVRNSVEIYENWRSLCRRETLTKIVDSRQFFLTKKRNFSIRQ